MVSLCPFLGENGGVVGVASNHHFSKFFPKSKIDVNKVFRLSILTWQNLVENIQ